MRLAGLEDCRHGCLTEDIRDGRFMSRCFLESAPMRVGPSNSFAKRSRTSSLAPGERLFALNVYSTGRGPEPKLSLAGGTTIRSSTSGWILIREGSRRVV